MSFNDYYIRCKETDVTELIYLGTILGILKEDPLNEGTYTTTNPACVWVPIGPIWRDLDTPTPTQSKAPDGSVWWHANLRLDVDLLEYAQAVYTANPSPQLAQGLAAISNYFYTDANGRATRPAQPTVDFA